MLGIRFMTGALAMGVALGATTFAHSATDDASLRADLERIAQQRILFGHQSVGVNILDGVKQLSSMAGVKLHLDVVKSASDIKQAMIGQTYIADNGFPLKKLKSFEQAIGQKPKGLEVALMKFCYVDFTPETNVSALFESYRSTLGALQAKNPGTTFVHVTVPLTVVQSGLKGRVKRLIGKAPYGVLENIRREEYNALLRHAFMGREPIFDLARVESTAPDGTVETVEWNGSVTPAMVAGYSDDGAHLNAAGKSRAARELVSVLAKIPVRPAASKPIR